jgi:hypothetical protein
MELLGIDLTPALVVLCVGCLIPVLFAWLEARADRELNRRVDAVLAEFTKEVESHKE